MQWICTYCPYCDRFAHFIYVKIIRKLIRHRHPATAISLCIAHSSKSSLARSQSHSNPHFTFRKCISNRTTICWKLVFHQIYSSEPSVLYIRCIIQEIGFANYWTRSLERREQGNPIFIFQHKSSCSFITMIIITLDPKPTLIKTDIRT